MLNKINLKSLSRGDIYGFFHEKGLPRYRAEQLVHWIYKKYASEISEITEFSKNLRTALAEVSFISNLTIIKRLTSDDGTQKFLFSLEDGNTIESVLIEDDERLTLCISSQVGCAMGCRFCLTGENGFTRNLKQYEIIDQIISVNRILQNEKHDLPSRRFERIARERIFPEKITNVVFMGMGEPLMNFDNIVEALAMIVEFLGISRRRVTLSTSGIAPNVLLLSEKAPEINLAVSLNATTDDIRNRIMPVNRKYPIKSVLDACRKYPLQPARKITFEYVLIDGINDSCEDARNLARLLGGIRCKVNLIPLNPYPGSDLKKPSREKILEFQKILLGKRIRALIRESKGQDILAACGQLRGGRD